MTVDRVIFCWDGNPMFSGMYLLQRRLWAKLGVKTTLFIVGAPEIDLPDSIHLETAPELPQDPPGGRNWKATMALLHGPRMFPGEVIMTSGLDQFPLGRMFLDEIADIPDDQFVIGFGGVGGSYDKLFDGVRYYPSSHLVAHHDQWMSVMSLAPGEFPGFLRWACEKDWKVMWPEHAILWGMDEAVLGQLLHKCSAGQLLRHAILEPLILSPEFFKNWDSRRIGRGSGRVFAEESLRAGRYSELHAHRPMPDIEKAIIERVVEIL